MPTLAPFGEKLTDLFSRKYLIFVDFARPLNIDFFKLARNKNQPDHGINAVHLSISNFDVFGKV